MRGARYSAAVLVEIVRLSFEAWRIRRIRSGLRRAAARRDPAALARGPARGRRGVGGFLALMKAPFRPIRIAAGAFPPAEK